MFSPMPWYDSLPEVDESRMVQTPVREWEERSCHEKLVPKKRKEKGAKVSAMHNLVSNVSSLALHR
jgi:hypothetical protein